MTGAYYFRVLMVACNVGVAVLCAVDGHGTAAGLNAGAAVLNFLTLKGRDV